MAGNNIRIVTGGGDGQTVSSINVFKSVTVFLQGQLLELELLLLGILLTFGENTLKLLKQLQSLKVLQ